MRQRLFLSLSMPMFLLIVSFLFSRGEDVRAQIINNSGQDNVFTGVATANEVLEFTIANRLPQGRVTHISVQLLDSKILVAGGYSQSSGGSTYLASALLYDPKTGLWTNTGGMNVARGEGATATLLPNGEVLVVGGYMASNSAEIYNPVSGSWRLTNPMEANYLRHRATLLSDGRVLITGGTSTGAFEEVGYQYPQYTASEIYDPATDTWESAGFLNQGRYHHIAVLLADNRVLVAGGDNMQQNLSSAEIYDPESGTWTVAAKMSSVRELAVAALLDNGTVLVAGGAVRGLGNLSNAEIYDPQTNIWRQAGSMGSGHAAATITKLQNGDILVASYGNADLYHVDSGTWNLHSVRMMDGRFWHTANLLPDGRVLFAGGAGSDWSSTEIATYTPANTFTGTLKLPAGWLNTHDVQLEIVLDSSSAPLDSASIGNDNTTWGSWLSVKSGEPFTVTLDMGEDGANRTSGSI